MKKILFLLVVSLFAFQLTCFAVTNITGNSGTIKVTPPGGGTPITIKAGEPIPAIVDGSTIEILSGDLTVTTTAPSTVDLLANGNTIALPSGSAIQVSLNKNGATRVHDSAGTASVTTANGKVTSLKLGQTIVIAGNSVKNAEAYQPPAINLGPVNTQVQIDDSRKDISPTS